MYLNCCMLGKKRGWVGGSGVGGEGGGGGSFAARQLFMHPTCGRGIEIEKESVGARLPRSLAPAYSRAHPSSLSHPPTYSAGASARHTLRARRLRPRGDPSPHPPQGRQGDGQLRGPGWRGRGQAHMVPGQAHTQEVRAGICVWRRFSGRVRLDQKLLPFPLSLQHKQ